MLIDTASALTACCDETIHAGGYVAMDTEFVRERTYRAELCLVQLATSDDTVHLVDPLAIDDLSALRKLCQDDGVLKIFHAARQDLEVLYQNLGVVPRPLFDTQLAAALCGYGEQIGYAALVQKIIGVELPKDHTRTDWSRRPLKDAQLRYAREDVHYLARCQQHLRDELDRLGRTEWLLEDLQQWVNEDHYIVTPMSAWERVKGMSNLSHEERGQLVTLAAWREDEASTSNLPREWILKDRVLVDLVRRCSAMDAQLSDDDLVDVGLTQKQLRQWGDVLREMLAAEPLDIDHVVTPRLTGTDEKRRKSLSAMLKREAQALGVSAPVLGTKRDVEHLIVAPHKCALLRGWRREVIGEALLNQR